MDNLEFWLVWSPHGHRPPSRQHLSAESAGDEAERLAAANPGNYFYVLHAVEVRRTANAPVESLVLAKREPSDDDELPF
ncbi:hypothetical protein QMO14_17820 [Variovorax sp. CAN2819]|uniref:hypothetical protein n=1 Tax=Variovorax sp. CAN15 TaxID=3046727 RepID=UPI00264951DB|nr:hypothetical protein [Variovorax sp. CAN15]MDN6885456.1 hypothetical protein [Variovorax sp. CAN15]